jgi:tape measure domain-containing protein
VARSTVELIVDAAKAINPLRRVTVETKKLEGAVKDANGRLRDAKGRFIGVGNGAKKASGGVKSLSTAVKGLFIGLSAIEAAKFVFFKTAELQTQTRSLKVLTGSLEDAEGIIKSLQGFAAITPFTSEELIDTAKRLKAFGFETDELVGIVSRLGDVAGATGADLGGIATAFGQIQAKGRLQGEELLQLQERGVDLQGTLRKEYDLTKEEFKKALESGRINAEAVSFALRKLTDEGGKYANGAIAQSDTLSGRFSTLVDNISAIARRVGEVLTPAVDGLLKSLNESLAAFNALIAVSGSAAVTQANIKLALPGGDAQDLLEIAGVLKALPKDPANKELAAQLKTIGANQLDVIANFGILMRESGRQLPEAYQTALDAAKELMSIEVKLAKKAGARPDLDDPRITQTQTGLSPEQQARKAGAERLQALQDQALIVSGITEEERTMLTLETKIAAINRNRNVLGDALAEKLIAAEKNLVRQKIVAKDLTKEEKERLAVSDRLAQEMQKQKEFAAQVGQTIKQGITNSILDAVEGSKSLSESLSGILRQLGGMFLNAGIGGIGKALKIPGFANGGRPAVGRPSVVGERGPELFVPDRAGTIVPNNAMGGSASVTVNVDASGSSVEGDGDQAAQLGKAIGIAVQQELIKQKRPGGLLTR